MGNKYIAIGSTNPAKIQAIQDLMPQYAILSDGEAVSIEVDSEVSDQPLSMEEVIRGAKNRARKAFAACCARWQTCAYSFGLESGLMAAPGTQTGYFEACVCCIYDGKEDHCGLSSGFEIPPAILKLVLEEHLDLNQACYRTGISTNDKLGSAEGFIGLLTRGRVDRKIYTQQSIITALVQLENADWWTNQTQKMGPIA